MAQTDRQTDRQTNNIKKNFAQKKTFFKLSLIALSLFSAQQAYAGLTVTGTVSKIDPNAPAQPDGYIYAVNGGGDNTPCKDCQIQVGPGTVGEMIINGGTKLRTGEAHIGNLSSDNSKAIVRADGKGTEWIINGRLNVGHYGDGELYITNGAVVTQLGESETNIIRDDNYFLWSSNKSLIEISGEGSTLTMNNSIRASYYDSEHGNKFTIRDGGTLNLNGKTADDGGSLYLPHIVNAGGTINASEHLSISEVLQLGSDDGTQAGDFNFKKGLSLNGAKLIVKKLKEPTKEIPLKYCYECSIEYLTNEKMLLTGGKSLNSDTITMHKGGIAIEDQESFNVFSVKALNIGEEAVLQLNKVDNAVNEDRNKIHIENFTHNGILDLADGKDNPNFSYLNINDYTTGGILQIDTVWNNDPSTSNSDKIRIIGTIAMQNPTKVETKNGIIGDIQTTEETQYSPVVVEVEKEHEGNAFVGTARTTHAGVAQLAKVGNNYHWSLGPTPEKPFLMENAAAYTQMPYANMELVYNTVGTLLSRRGNAFSSSKPNETWGRIFFNQTNTQGAERFGMKQKQYIAQIGQDLLHSESEEYKAKTGIYGALAYSNMSFTDEFRGVNGEVAKDKFVGTGATKAGMIGFYHTLQNNSQAYLDIVGNIGYLRNQYKPREGESQSNTGLNASLSLELGRKFEFDQSGWALEPQAQIIYQYLKLKDIQDQNITVEQDDLQGARARLGIRLSYQDRFSFITNLWQDLTPANWVQIGTESYREKQARSWLEVGLVTQLYSTKNFSIYTDLRATHSLRGPKRTSYEGKIGMQVSW